MKFIIRYLLVCGIVTLSYTLFLVVAGIPSTHARNLYNNARIAQDRSEQIRLLEESIKTWRTADAEKLLFEIQTTEVN